MSEQIPSRVEMNRRRKKPHHLRHFILWLLAIIIVGVACYAGYLYHRTKQAADLTYDPNNKVTSTADFNGKKPFSILLLGTDTGALGRTAKRGNSDTMIIATVNPQQKKFSLMSIPRDTMAEMIGTPNFSVHKINAAYNIGGAKMAMRTSSKLLAVPIKYYVVLNMGGLRKMVNGVGGVDVTPPLTFTFDGYKFTKGQKVHLNGKQALAYARMRYDDPQGDYGRQLRQRQVIMSMIDHAASLKTLTNLEDILDSAENNVRTNLTFNDMVAIVKNYRQCTAHQSSDYLHGNGAMIGDASYQVMKTSELQRCSDKVRRSLGLSTVTLDNNETYQNRKNTSFDWSSSDQNQVYRIYEPDSDKLWDGDRYD
ncbi:MAG: LCP family protein [Lactobacillus sp.]|jgi:LCP family protein required for cell wall assembly|nr:LCP family protein [Lactobacillus sp.]MCH3990648.1 LCP family protein [Lactobacillus sp.]MCH4068636.1 LCP family protein [Lactobacillus sp.]MCI1304531.1 LCP family protein [Lactobacillus sp.]MCI1330627.1 LCP family protein [Lactobacillus sp.]